MQGEFTNPRGKCHCTCSKQCSGGKWVSYNTFLAHGKYREADKDVHFAGFTAQFGAANATTTKRRKTAHFTDALSKEVSHASSSSETRPPDFDVSSDTWSSDTRTPDFDAPPEAQPPNFDASSLSEPPPLDHILANSSAGSLAAIGEEGVWQYRSGSGDMSGDEGEKGEQEVDEDSEGPADLDNTEIPDSDDEDFHAKFTDCRRSSHLKLALSQELIASIRNARIDDDMDAEMISALQNPSHTPPDIDETTKTSIGIFLNTSNGSQAMYAGIKDTLARRCNPVKIHSHHIVKNIIREMTGINAIETDMCINSCLAYTGPLSLLEDCPHCGEPRYESTSRKRVARKRFSTIPLGPQLQAMYRSPEGADRMHYRARKTRDILQQLACNDDEVDVYEDVYHGEDYLAAVRRGDISEDDVVFMFSLDGAQLYRDKASDCWFFIWVNFNLPPEIRYKKKYVIPAGFVPGPNKPVNIESFLLPSFRHFSALQKNGLKIWDAHRQEEYMVHPYWLFGTADTLGLTTLSGLVGHGGRLGCRHFCGFPGRRKDRQPRYYPAALKPDNYNVANSSHPDVEVDNLPSPSRSRYAHALSMLLMATDAHYERLRLATGVARPSIVLGLQPNRTLSVPRCFTPDTMHLACLNVPQHLLEIWRNTLKPRVSSEYHFTVLQSDDVWKSHGALVASARPYIPGSFNRTPRNPAEKVNSGYKAWEFNLYFYLLGPAVFRLVLPHYLWTHFCQLVRGIRIIFQRRITSEQIKEAHEMLVKWGKQFEEYYYQRKSDLLHLVRPSTHAILHLALETVRCGPLNLVAQWVLEDTVGNIGREVHQHSNPFANLTQRGLLRAQTNALMSLIPDLNPSKHLPRGAAALNGGFALLAAREAHWHGLIPLAEKTAILRYLSSTQCRLPLQNELMMRKWARLLLPNGQKARCAWKEEAKEGKQDYRNSRNIKFIDEVSKKTYYAEVLYYFQISVNNVESTAAMTRPYTNPDPKLLKESHGTLYVCQPRENIFHVIDIKTIQSVVAMIPFPLRKEEEEVPAIKESYENSFYVGEKPFFELTIEGKDDEGSDAEDTMD